jgi:hypothetical protein
MARTKPSDIPNIVYDNLRAVAESRVRRALEPEALLDLEMPRLSNSDIFFHMPDHGLIDWSEASQARITSTTLGAIIAELRNRIDS